MVLVLRMSHWTWHLCIALRSTSQFVVHRCMCASRRRGAPRGAAAMSRPSFRQIQALSHTARRRGADYARLAVLEIHPPLRVLIARLRPSPSALLLPVTAAGVGVALITTTPTGAIRGPESPIELVPPSPPKVTNPAGPYDSSRPNPKRSAVALPARPADAAD